MSNTDLTQHRLRLGTFVFDPVARQVLDDGGRAVAVLRQSLRVLCELAARNSEVVERDDLINAAWARRSVSDDNLVQ